MSATPPSTDSILIDSLYSAAIDPKAYTQFTEVWEDRVMSTLLRQPNPSLREAAEDLDLARHFRRALQLFETHRLARQDDIRDFLSNRNHAAALVRADGTVQASNALFDQLIGEDGGQSLFSRFTHLDPQSEQSVHELLSDGPRDLVVRFEPPDGPRELLLIEPMTRRGQVQRSHQDDPGGVTFLVKSCRADWGERATQLIARSFGLSPTEASVAEELYRGRRSHEIAANRKRSKETVRKQVKAVLHKTGAQDQAELICMLTGILHVFESAPRREHVGESLVWGNGAFHRASVLPLPGHLALRYHEFGRADGDPFLFLQGHTSTAEPAPELVRACAERGLRVIAPCRPESSAGAPADETWSPELWGDACLRLLQQLGITGIPIAGHAMSGVSAIRLAARAPGTFSAAALFDTGAPMLDGPQFSAMPPKSRQVFWTAKETPELLYAPFAFAAQAFESGPEGERIFMNAQFEESVHDTRLLQSLPMYRGARQAMSEFVCAPRRAVDELRLWVSDWTGALRVSLDHMPVFLIHSELHDWLPIGEVQRYAQAQDGLGCIVLADTAQLFIFEKPAEFASAARQVADSPRRG